MTAPTTAPAAAASHSDRAVRLLAAIRVTLVIALTALVLAIAALAYVVSFEAIRAFAIETAAFPPELAWSAPLLVDSFTTAASLVILWRYLRGEGWRAPWYAWSLVGCATAVSVALNVARAPDRLSAQLFAALPRSRCWGVGAVDERGSHRPAAHRPHPDRAGPQQRPRRHRDGGRPAAAARTRPQRGHRQRQWPAGRQPHPGP
jgi:Protein of unknown function (DUF2637)